MKGDLEGEGLPIGWLHFDLVSVTEEYMCVGTYVCLYHQNPVYLMRRLAMHAKLAMSFTKPLICRRCTNRYFMTSPSITAPFGSLASIACPFALATPLRPLSGTDTQSFTVPSAANI